MEQLGETNPNDYPLGRGYGHDYMRGGEVFGGYGYREREEYTKTRGGDVPDAADAEPDAPAALPGDGDARRPEAAAPRAESAGASAGPDDIQPPVPELEDTYGTTGRGWRHSRSYYVTQAQLQQRIYGPQRHGAGPYRERLRTLMRQDGELKRDVEEALFFDTWVDAQRIVVDVADGVVTLSGALPNPDEIRFACDDAWAVAGVREVKSELRLVASSPELPGSPVS
ncbi:MAG: BON domain-containing protein [Gemmatimonadaceae bacterium]